ncbi:MAG TPA: ABC transporter substrate-binding protein [Solirubrobacterales bacterium]|nr:ABC transporter substrate-binding protein [Solirubrobacterales bacterium]
MMGPLGSKTRNAVLALVALATLVLAGCGGSGGSGGSGDSTAAIKTGGTLRVGMGAEISNLTPSAPETIGAPEIYAVDQINETLYRASSEGKVFPWLVKSGKPSADGLTWTFELKPGIKFSDGKPLTAEDVVFSLEQARKCVNYSFVYEPIKSIKATSPSTVVIKVEKPVPAMEANLALYAAAIVPKNYGGLSEKAFGQHPTGTGPFMFESWQKGKALTLAKNPNYWNQGEPKLDKLVFIGIQEDSSRLAQLRSGDIDMAFGPEFSQLKTIESTPGLKLSDYALNSAEFIAYNVDSKLFSNPKAREAANLAIDRESIVKVAFGGYGELGGSWLAPTLPYWTEIEPTEHNLTKSKEVLAEAEKEGADPSFTLKYSSGGVVQRTEAQIIQSNLKEAGFQVDLEPVDPTVILEQVATEEYGAFLTPIISDIPDPSELVGLYAGGLEGIFTHPKNLEELQKLGAKAETEQDSTKRGELYAEFQEMVAEEENLSTLGYSPQLFAMKDNVEGYEPVSAGGPWFAQVGFAE